MMSDLTCAICDLEPTNEYPTWRQKDGVIRHQNTLVCLGAAIARAEAAEKRIAVATEMARDANRYGNREREAKEAAEQRITELQAQLDAQWRPVTDDWPPHSKSLPVVMRDGTVRYGYRQSTRWHLTGGVFVAGAVTHAFQLPPPPSGE